jgi:hypothetical protein
VGWLWTSICHCESLIRHHRTLSGSLPALSISSQDFACRSAVLTRQGVPHIQRASDLPRRTISAPSPACPLVRFGVALAILVAAVFALLEPPAASCSQGVQHTVVEEVPDPAHAPHAAPPAQAYELLQGNLVRFSGDATSKDVPTAVLVHGILGSKRNLNSFARMLVEVSSSSSRHACAGQPCVCVPSSCLPRPACLVRRASRRGRWWWLTCAATGSQQQQLAAMQP